MTWPNLLSRPTQRVARCVVASKRQLSTPSSAADPKIAFIGLGNMGLPMTVNLAKQNTGVMAFDLNDKAMKLVEEAGAIPAASIEEIGTSGCNVIFTMLPGCAAVNAVMSQLLDAVPQGSPPTMFVDCSTVHPTTTRQWFEKVSSLGHSRIDAPVSGGVKGAQDGTLTFMVGCNGSSDLEIAKPYLDIMGQRTIECGVPGAGSATKLCNNLALAAQMIGICEAMNLGESLNVDPVVLADVMNISTAKSWSCEVNNPHPEVAALKGSPASKGYEGGFGTKLMLKDLGLAVSAATEAGVALPITSASKELYKMADAHGLGGKDFGIMLQFLRGKTK